MEGKERYCGLDGIRTYAILGIVIMHVRANGDYQIGGFLYNSLIPAFTNFVFLFMMVSAFGMCCGYYEKIRSGSISVDEFYKKRYEKIWPYFTILCLLDLIISPSLNSVYEVFANLTLCFGLLPNANISVIGVGWTLGVIFVFYLLFPFFCFLAGTKKRAWFVLLIAIIYNIIASIYFGAGRTNIIYSAVYFMAGGLIYLYREQLSIFVARKKVIAILLAIIAGVTYFVIGFNTITMLLVCVTFLVCALGVEKEGVLFNPITKFISGISFEIYLCHMVIYHVIEKLRITHLFNSEIVSYVFTCIGTIGGAIVFSVVVQWGINKTMLKVKK